MIGIPLFSVLFSLSNDEFDFECGGVTSLGTVSISVCFVSLLCLFASLSLSLTGRC